MLQWLYSVDWYEKVEVGRDLKEVVAYLKILSHYLHGENEDNRGNLRTANKPGWALNWVPSKDKQTYSTNAASPHLVLQPYQAQKLLDIIRLLLIRKVVDCF